jgi:hypothetical protein
VSHAPSSPPNVAEILAAVLQRVPRPQQPLLIALAERLAAARYRAWAGDPGALSWKDELFACADREEEIAGRIESLYTGAASTQRALRAAIPELEGINRDLFAGRPLLQQFAIQAQGERLGAATWRAFAAHAAEAERGVFLSCAELEEESATLLERIVGAAASD